jgi:hypothetical protein
MMPRGWAERSTLQSGATGTGNGTPMSVAGLTWLGLQIVGITTATITWECSNDGVTWTGIQATPLSTGTAAATATADGMYRANVSGLSLVRARISAYTSGTISVFAVGTTEG